MITVSELYRYFDESVPKSLSCSWDNDGLMCTVNPNKEVSKVLLTLDVTEKAADFAIENGFDLIISHHPLIFKPIPSLSPSDSVRKALIKLIKSEISVFSFHTRLDAVNGGVNDALSEKLGIADPQLLNEKGEGRIGFVGEIGLSIEEFASFVKKRLNAPTVKYVDAGKTVNKVALVGGSGREFIEKAIEEGADTFVTGELGYSTMNSYLDGRINLIEAGHFYTENPVLDKIDLMIKGYCDIYTEKFFSDEIKSI